MTADNTDVCVEHEWELRDVDFDIRIGTLEDYECCRCSAVTVRQAASDAVALG